MGQRGQYSGEVFGEVRLQDLIARGGMGEIYRGHHEVLDIAVAIKVILPSQGADSEFKERFLREARASLQLTHPNILRVFTAAKKGSVYYIVMEYVDGTDVKQILKTHKRIDWRYSVNIIKQTCDGLSFAHKQGVIHRDVKPDNIMITRKGLIKIADFGLAMMKSSQSALTTTGQVLGTPLFMSPEQCKGIKADNRADIYSLGITWYNMVVGRPPFIGESPAAVIGQHLQRPPHYPEAIFSKVPNRLQAVIDKMLEKDRENRFDNFDEVLQQISKLSQEFTKKIGQSEVKQVVQQIQYKQNKRPISSAEIPRVTIEEIQKHADEASSSMNNRVDVSELDADELLDDNTPRKGRNSEIRINSISGSVTKTDANFDKKKKTQIDRLTPKTATSKLHRKPQTGFVERQPFSVENDSYNKNLNFTDSYVPEYKPASNAGDGKMLTIIFFVLILLLAAGGVILLPKLLDLDSIKNPSTTKETEKNKLWILCTTKNNRDETSIFKVSEDGKDIIQLSKGTEERIYPIYNDVLDLYVYLERVKNGYNLLTDDGKGKKNVLIDAADMTAPHPKSSIFLEEDSKSVFFIDTDFNLVVLNIKNSGISWKRIQFNFNDKKVPLLSFNIRKNKIAFISKDNKENRILWYSDIFDDINSNSEGKNLVLRYLKPKDQIFKSNNKLMYLFFNPAGTRVGFLENTKKGDEINSLNLLGSAKNNLFKSDNIKIRGCITWLEYEKTLLFIGQKVKTDNDDSDGNDNKFHMFKLNIKDIHPSPVSMISDDFEVTSFSIMYK